MIQDPAAGAGGFLVSADHYIKAATDDLYALSQAEAFFQRNNAYVGMELAPDTQRLALMNLMLHGNRFMQTIDLSPFAVATAVPSVRRGDVADLQLPLPPLDEQLEIVRLIDAAFAEIDRLTAEAAAFYEAALPMEWTGAAAFVAAAFTHVRAVS